MKCTNSLFDIKSLFNPFKLQITIMLLNMLIVLLFKLGIYKSFTIGNASLPLIGLIHVFVSTAMFLTYMNLFMRFRINRPSFRRWIVPRRYLSLIAFCFSLIAFIGLVLRFGIGVFQLLINPEIYIFGQRLVSESRSSTGTIGMWLFSIVSTEIFIIYRLKARWLFVTVNLLISFIYATFLNARIFVLYQVVIILFFVLLSLKTRRSALLFFVFLLIVLLIALFISAGNRDYREFGIFFTDSKIQWGLHTIIDYPLSCALFSTKVASEPISIGQTQSNMSGQFLLGIRMYFRDQTSFLAGGVVAYNNLGFIGHLYSALSVLYIPILIVIAFFYSISWSSFLAGRSFGYLTYPIVLISIVESFRFAFPLLEIGFFALVIASILALLLPDPINVHKQNKIPF